MQYQHLVFEEFARTLVPTINLFQPDGINFQSDINPAITAEFAHQVYRLGHSMLNETIERTWDDGTTETITLFDGFLNPLEFNDRGTERRSTRPKRLARSSRVAPASAATRSTSSSSMCCVTSSSGFRSTSRR